MRTFGNNDRWMAYLLQVLGDFDSELLQTKVANIENTKLDITKLEHNATWGAKKTAINIVKKYAFRYAIPQDETLDNEKFALYWSNTWALKFVEVSLKYFEWKNLKISSRS